uniref:Uncharacterized protein n=1 Tax=uncultured bacterium contig00043 TaxID=1181530 RepID=A0A806K082_9BACT|nr:hypothetical protein [uncultured bacterium contig00043]
MTEETPLLSFKLCSPLEYVKILYFPEKLAIEDEILLCFDLDPAQSLSIEPDPEHFLAAQVFIGQKKGGETVEAGKVSENAVLPPGQYIFSQRREKSESPAGIDCKWRDFAIEQQKDALWERRKPGNRLYVRFLYEDGAQVTQIFRAL